MQLKVSDKQEIALAYPAKMQSQVVVAEHALALVHGVYFIVN